MKEPGCLCCGNTEMLTAIHLSNRGRNASPICAQCGSEIYASVQAGYSVTELDELIKMKRQINRLYTKGPAMTEADNLTLERIHARVVQLQRSYDQDPSAH